MTLYERRERFHGFSVKIGIAFAKLRLSPNQWTVLALVPVLAAFYMLAREQFLWAALFFIVAGFIDMIDGAVARVSSLGAENADVSPDGQLVVIVRHGELWLHRLKDGYERPLTRDGAEALSPRFSPDGRQVIYASTRSGNYDLWLLDLPVEE